MYSFSLTRIASRGAWLAALSMAGVACATGPGPGGTGSSQSGVTGGTGGGAMVSDGSNETYLEKAGIVAVEAEHYFEQANKGKRAWYFTSVDTQPGIKPDSDPNHAQLQPSGGAYMEVLPDTRVTHDDSLADALFRTGEGGPTLRYRVRFTTTGTYWLWARAFSTGSEDNGVHVGIDGSFPDSGKQMQWCTGKGTWAWSSNQRDSGGTSCGLRNTISLEVKTAGEHVIEFAMREDGYEMDRWLMSTDKSYTPSDAGPDEVIAP